jgi:hypothetical protein
VRTEGDQEGHFVGELAQGVGEREAGQRVPASAVHEQVERLDPPNGSEMLRDDGQHIVADLDGLVLTVAGDVAEDRRPPRLL